MGLHIIKSIIHDAKIANAKPKYLHQQCAVGTYCQDIIATLMGKCTFYRAGYLTIKYDQQYKY